MRHLKTSDYIPGSDHDIMTREVEEQISKE